MTSLCVENNEAIHLEGLEPWTKMPFLPQQEKQGQSAKWWNNLSSYNLRGLISPFLHGPSICRGIKSKALSWWNHVRFNCHRTLISFLMFKVILLLADVGTDLYTGIKHFQNGDKQWGILTIGIMFLPFGVSLLFHLFNVFHRTATSPPGQLLMNLPFVQAFRNLYIFVGLGTMDLSNPLNFNLKTCLELKAKETSALEAILEAGPQLLLQTYIVLKTGNIGFTIQTFGIICSFVSAFIGSIDMIFIRHQFKEKYPSWKFKSALSPIVLAYTMNKVTMAMIMAIKFEHDAPSWLSNNLLMTLIILFFFDDQIQNLTKSIALRKIWTFLKVLVTILIYKNEIEVIILSIQKDRRTVQEYSVLVCCPQNLIIEAPILEETQIFFDIYQAFMMQYNNAEKHVVRICHNGEHPTFVLFYLIPFSIAVLLHKLAADFLLFKLTDYHKFTKFMKIFGSNMFHYVHVIENPENHKNDDNIKRLFLENINQLNRQHPLTGQTIMHVAEKLMTPEEAATLFYMGSRIDIKDFDGKTAKDCWSSEFNEAVVVVQPKDEKEDGNAMTKSIDEGQSKWFSLLVYAGYQLKAKDTSGQSVYEKLAMKIANPTDLSFLRYLPYRNVTEFIMQLKMDDEAKKLTLIKNIFSQQRGIRTESFWLHLLKSIGRKETFSKFFHTDLNKRDALVNEISQIYYTKDFEELLSFACKKRKTILAKHLIDCKFNVNHQDFNDNTPLHLACEEGLGDFVHLLLISRAHRNLKNINGSTPLHLASKNGHHKCVEHLLEYGTYSIWRDKQGWTALNLARAMLEDPTLTVEDRENYSKCAHYLENQSPVWVIYRQLCQCMNRKYM